MLCLTFVSQPDGQLILYAGTETDGLWVSSDAGEHWQIVLLRLRDSINALSVPAPGVLCFEQGGNLLCFSTTTNSVINMDSLIAQSASTAMAVWRDELQQSMILVGTSEGQLETVRFRADPGVPFTKDYSLE